MITAEVAIYPLKTNNASKVIEDSINSLRGGDVDYEVHSMNTVINGTKEEVFSSLERMFAEAERSGGEVSMVVNIGNNHR